MFDCDFSDSSEFPELQDADAVFSRSDDAVLEQLVLPDDGESDQRQPPKEQQGSAAKGIVNDDSNSSDPEHSCMNTALLLNTEAMGDFDSPMSMPTTQQQPFSEPPAPQIISIAAKRKSAELETPIRSTQFTQQRAIKRRQLLREDKQQTAATSTNSNWSDCGDDDDGCDFFRTQFLKQIDSLSGDSAAEHREGLSQYFMASQFDTLQLTQRAATSVSPMSITQAPNDDETDAKFDEDDRDRPIQRIDDSDLPPATADFSGLTQLLVDCDVAAGGSACTQRFLKDVQPVLEATAAAAFVAPTAIACSNPVTIYTNADQATAYIEMQRAMSELNAENVGDDDFLDPELSQAYKSTQYRRELEDMFNKCERSISDKTPANVDNENAALNDEHGLDSMIWSESDFAKTPIKTPLVCPQINAAPARTPLITPSVFVRTRLEELRRSSTAKQEQSSSKSVVSSITTTGLKMLGPFFGLPLRVKSLIRDFKGINELYDWQKQCLSLPAIARRDNLIYALPTSGGKTLVSEILILREVLCRRRNCLFVLPYVSIVQEKMWSLSPFAVELDFLLEEYAAGKGCLPPQQRRKKRSIYIATIEKALALLDSLIEAGRANELGLIVVDELHIIGEAGRGAVLETLLTKAMFIQAGIQIVGMSATIGNIPELATFLRADVFTRDFRPVELREYIKCGADVLHIQTDAATGGKTFELARQVDYNYRSSVAQRDPDHLAGLVSEVIPHESCLVFCPTKQNCENVALMLGEMLPRRLREHKAAQRDELMRFLEAEGRLCATLRRTLPFGVAYHHSGLTGEERRHLEDAFRQNILCVICCTSTLAAGVNLPAKRVILRSPYVGREFITLSRYKQMVGRAGRAGLCGDVGESILICGPRDNARVAELLCSPMDEAASSLHAQGAAGVEALLLSAIGARVANTRADLHRLLGSTLMAVQAKRLNVDVTQLTRTVLAQLFRMKTLKVVPIKEGSMVAPRRSTASQLNQCDDDTLEVTAFDEDDDLLLQQTPTSSTESAKSSSLHIKLDRSAALSISKLGRASFKSGFSVQKARIVYRDLKQAQRSLVLSSFLHLLYVVTPYEAHTVNVRPRADIYYAQFAALSREEQRVAQALGITEQVAQRIRGELSIRPADLERIVSRFYMTLMLHELWQQRSIFEVADAFAVNRGVVQALTQAAASYASSVLKCCEELDEFWAMRELLRHLTKRLSYCCTAELVPLMDLPGVKLARAKQLYAAGYKTLEHVAKADVRRLEESVQHLNGRVAKQLVAAAKVLLLEKVESLREEVQDCLDVLGGRSTNAQNDGSDADIM